MAKEKGFYDEAGLDVEIREIEVGKVAVDELIHQNANYAVVDPGVLLARAEGAPIKILAAIFQHSPLALIVRDEPSIQSIDDLKGKRIMMVPGLNADITAALNSVGISPSDFIRQDISFDINDLIIGNTDAFSGYITDQPYQLDLLGFKYRIFHPKDQGIEFYGDILITSEREVQKNPERVKAFKMQSMRGWQYALEHIDETIDVIQTKYNSQNLSRRQLKFEALKTKEMISENVIQIGYMSPHRWEHITGLYMEQGLLPENFSISDALYQPKVSISNLVQENLTFITSIAVILIIILMLSHNYSLRRAVKLRTLELSENEKNFRNLFVANKCVELIIEPETGAITDINHAAENFYGYSREQILQLNISGINTLTKEEIKHEMALAAAEKRDHFIFQHRLASGEIRDVEVYSGPIIWHQKKHLYSIVHDITSRKKAEHELHLKNLTFEHALTANSIADKKGKLIYANQAFSEIWGFQNIEDVLGKPIGDFLKSKDQAQQIVQSLNERGNWQGEYTALKKDGSTFTAFGFATDILDANNNIIGYQSSVQDISKRKKNEEALNTLSQSVEQAGESILITDKKGFIEYVNTAFISLTGFSHEQVYGKKARQFKSDRNTEITEEIKNTALSGETWRGKVYNRRKNGKFYPTMLTVSPIKNSAGEVTRAVAFQQDLSELESLEKQFQQAQKMEAMGTLVGGIAHDFNNMLAGITGNLFLAKKQTKGMADVNHRLDTIEDLSYRASDMIRQLLTFARKGPVDLNPVSLNTFMKETLKLLRTSIPENIDIQKNLTREPLQIMGDITQLHQILMNLMNNARDALETTNDPTIHIKLEKFLPNSEFIAEHPYFKTKLYARLSVSDNGCGIPKHQLEHLFEPFFTTKEEGKGTGLGLAMVFGTVKTHHGFIEVSSRVNTGTTFEVFLPLYEDQNLSSDTLDEKVFEGSGEKILIVDDNDEALTSNVEILNSLNYEVITARDGLEAVSTFQEHQDDIQLVLMDLVMPKLSGVGAAKKIMAYKPHIKIIFSTGYDKGAVLKDKTFIDNYLILAKPHSIPLLSKAIKDQLNK